LAHNADPNGRGHYEPPAKKPDPKREQYRIKEKECEGTALMLAAKLGYYDIAKQLIDNGADVNLVDASGCTALRVAEREGHGQIVELIRSHGAAE
jgi:ankyrin repeat protein